MAETEDLVKRFRDLEASQAKLREQLDVVMLERRGEGGDRAMIPGVFAHSPYRSVLQNLGHALHVCRPATGEIIYWNRSAEYLYGWKDYEALGQRVGNLIMYEESRPYLEKVMEILNSGQSWSGQFPLRKRSGEKFVAMVTKTPLYEDGELIGVITVSSDASMLNNKNSEKLRMSWDQVHSHPRDSKLNFKRVHWRPQPQIASSVSSLASKLFSRNSTNCISEGEIFQERCECMLEKEKLHSEERCECLLEKEKLHSERREVSASESIFRLHVGRRSLEGKTIKYEETLSKFSQQIKIAARSFAKMHIQGGAAHAKESDESIQASSSNNLMCNSINKQQTRSSQAISTGNSTGFSEINGYVPKEQLQYSNLIHRYVDDDPLKNMKSAECCATSSPEVLKEKVLGQWSHSFDSRVQCSERSSSVEETRCEFSNDKENESLEGSNKDDALQRQENPRDDLSASATLQKKHTSQKKTEDAHSSTSTISVETTGSRQAGSAMNEEKASNLVANCDIHWEDLFLGEEIGEGSYAVVYRGVWNGSDVAIKVYLSRDYRERILPDYKREVTIMKRLRHPNVLLFMGAAYSPDRLGIVTEFLPRGSLFRTLHKNNQTLDIKRRLRMALDVARGMNYLHRRNPPIIHRDLKSSNLLVDKNWTVKVGDFGLSCLKNSVVLTAKTGRGTAQWMAPEVLRGECTSEKSDVFSFGVIVWELMTESVPWSHLNYLQVVGVVGFMDRRLDIPEGLDPRVSSVISDCWESDPGRRPSFEDLVGRVAAMAGSVTAAPACLRSGQHVQAPSSD